MSQVVVIEDSLKERRDKSKKQEDQINREDMFKRWRKNDITGKDFVAMTIGIVAIPLFVCWAIILGLISLIVWGFKYLMLGIGAIVGGKKSIITK